MTQLCRDWANIEKQECAPQGLVLLLAQKALYLLDSFRVISPKSAKSGDW